MASNLEKITEDYTPRNYSEGLEGMSNQEIISYQFPALYKFTNSIKDKKRKKEMEQEINRLFYNYVESIKKYAPATGRAVALEKSYDLVPDEEEIENKNPKEVLEKRLYSSPGRHYQYVNGIVGNKNKSKDIKKEIGKAAKYAIKEGWPIIGAGAGWVIANRKYKKSGNIIKRANKAFDNKWWQYLGPIGGIRFGADAGKFIGGEVLRQGWKSIRKPAAYAIGAYAAYKVISYLIKRKKEKKLENEEIEKLENLRNEMLAQKQFYYAPIQEMGEAA